MLGDEVLTNWTRFAQYFDFWKVFLEAGEVQVRYMFQKDFISHFMDVFFENTPPVVVIKNKKKLSKYSKPKYDNLARLLHALVQ